MEISENDPSAMHQALVDQLKRKGVLSSLSVEAAFRVVPRHLFLPEISLEEVYCNQAIVTKRADGNAISSSSEPGIMAIMLEQLQLEPGHNVLEIGTGTGYNAALMAHIVGNSGRVVTIDIDEELVEKAHMHIASAGFDNVQVLCADGGLGYATAGPYDRIILTVNAGDIAPAWRNQLKPEGRLVLPFSLRGTQAVVTFEHDSDHLTSVSVIPCGDFIGLQGILSEPSSYIRLDPEQGFLYLRLSEQHSVNSERICQLLTGSYRDVSTQLHVTFRQIVDGLAWWLALHEPQFCTLVANETALERGIVPEVFNFSKHSKTASMLGLLSETSLSILLHPSEDTVLGEQAVDIPAFELVVRCFGPDETLAERLVKQIGAWNTSGRPGRENLHIKAFSHESEYVLAANEVGIPKRWTKFVIGWHMEK